MKFSIIFFIQNDLHGRRGGKYLEGVKGEETIIKIYYMREKKSIFNKWEKFKSQDLGSVSRMKDFCRNLEGVSLDSQRKPDMLSQSSNLSPPDARWETVTGNCSQSSYVGLRRPYLEGERKRQMCKLFSKFCYKIF